MRSSLWLGVHHRFAPINPLSTPTPSYPSPVQLIVSYDGPQVSSLAWVMQQTPYSATAPSSAKPARPSMCPPHHPHRPHRLALYPPSRRTSPSLQDSLVAHTAHGAQPRHRNLGQPRLSRRRRAACRLPSQLAQSCTPQGVRSGAWLPNCTSCYRPRECTATCLTTPRGERRKGAASLKRQPWRSIG